MSTTVTLASNGLTATISAAGAQLLSFKDENTEYMWQADSNVWGFTAPVLFPICGRLKNNTCTIDGKEYEMDIHGFARFKEFSVESADEAKVCFLLTSDEDTKKSYPYDFEFRVIFEISGKKLNITYAVANPSDKEICFSFGGHEGYACKEGAEEYYIQFEKDSTLTRHMLTDGFYNYETEEIELTDGKLMLNYDEFDKCTYMFRNINSDSVILSKKDESHKVRIGFEGHSVLALWTLRPRNYVCIEPWCGNSETIDFDGDFTEKDGLIKLAPSEKIAKTH